MNRTPLLRKLREDGATLYIFPSASEDIGLNLDSRVNNAALSHYALLNFPEMSYDSETLAQQIQNYVMNFETLLLNQDKYNYQEYATVSERVFWHWVNKQGWLNLDKASTENIYIEQKTNDTDRTNDKQRFVQCFGSIDAGNTLSTEFGMFNETYVNIPTSYGNGPVFFQEPDDTDYNKTNYLINHKYTATNNENILEGRNDSPVEGLSYLKNNDAIYDDNNSYIDNQPLEIIKNMNEIEKAVKTFIKYDNPDDNERRNNIIINSYDDMNVDARFQFAKTNFDITSDKVEFEFNAILLYYSVYDNSDDTKLPYAINLFGIIFLNSPQKMSEEETNFIIPGFTKRKSFGSNASDSFFGNSYSFRVNIKTMSVYDNTDAYIRDNTTMSSISSVDFNDVIAALNNAVDIMNNNVYATMSIQEKYNQIQSQLYDNRIFFDDVSTKVNGLINGSKTSFLATNTLRTNTIIPLNENNNTIKLSLNSANTDDVDPEYYQYHPYVSPIIITNDDENINMPTVYKPAVNIQAIAEAQVLQTDDDINNDGESDANTILNIINDTSVNYYKYNNSIIQNINIPFETIQSLNFNYLSKYIKDTVQYKDGTIEDTSVAYINYDGYIGLLINYVKSLNARIKILEEQIANLS